MKRVRAIIISDNKILIIKRTKTDGTYWVLPGGRVEEGETTEQALMREGKEELGLDVKVGELSSNIKSDKDETRGQDEFFYRCEIVGGELGSGQGPEFQKNSGYKGSYDFEWISLDELDNYDLRPKEIKKIISSYSK